MPVTRCPTWSFLCHSSLIATLAIAVEAFSGPNVATSPIDARDEPYPPVAVTGPRFRQTLDAPIAGLTWRGASVRDVLRETSTAFSIALIRDRRIDPTTAVDLALADVPLRRGLEEIAAQADASTRLVGNVAYIGPAESAELLRTVAEMRRSEIDAIRDHRLSDRRVALLRGETVRWGDLTESGEALRLVTDRFGLKAENPETLPHDLWPSGVLPELSAAEALTLVLIQFDLTFAWTEDLGAIRLIPLPPRAEVAVERRYTPQGSADVTAAAWRKRFPELDVRVDGASLIVRATVERHEELAGERRWAGGTRRTSEPERPGVVPLARRRFTLSVSRVPAKAVVEKLEESGIGFEFDETALSEAGIDLATPVTLDVRQVDADAFFTALFEPLGLEIEIEGNVVRLTPKSAEGIRSSE